MIRSRSTLGWWRSGVAMLLGTFALVATPVSGRGLAQQAAGQQSADEIRAVLGDLPKGWTELERTKEGAFEVPAHCDAGPRTLTFLDVAQGHPKLEVFLGQETQQFEVVSASKIAGRSGRAVRIELRSSEKGAPRRVIEFEYTDPARGLAVWSEPVKPRSPGVVLFKGRTTYGAKEKLGSFKVRTITCEGDGT